MLTKNKACEYLLFFSVDLLKKEIIDGFINISGKFNLEDFDLDNSLKNLLPDYFNLSLQSVRHILSIYLEEFAILGNLDNYNIKIYGSTPHQVVNFDAISNANSNAYVGFPDYLSTIILGLFFNKTNLFDSYDLYMSVNNRHCPFNQSKVSIFMKKLIPIPNIYWVNGTYCSEVAKAHELIENMGIKMKTTITTIIKDSKFLSNESKESAKVKYLANQYKNAYSDIYQATGIEVKTKDFSYAIKENSRIIKKLLLLEKLFNKSNSLSISINDTSLFSLILTLRLSQGYKKYERVLDKFIVDVEKDMKESIQNEELTKVSCSFIPLLAPKVHKELLEYNKKITHSIPLSIYNSAFDKINFLNPYEILAELWLRQPYSGNIGKYTEMIFEKLKNYKINTIYYGLFSFDRWLGAFEKQSIKPLDNEHNILSINIRKQFFSF